MFHDLPWAVTPPFPIYFAAMSSSSIFILHFIVSTAPWLKVKISMLYGFATKLQIFQNTTLELEQSLHKDKNRHNFQHQKSHSFVQFFQDTSLLDLTICYRLTLKMRGKPASSGYQVSSYTMLSEWRRRREKIRATVSSTIFLHTVNLLHGQASRKKINWMLTICVLEAFIKF